MKKNSEKWTMAPVALKVGDHSICLAGLHYADFKKLKSLIATEKKLNEERKKDPKFTAAKRKALERYLKPKTKISDGKMINILPSIKAIKEKFPDLHLFEKRGEPAYIREIVAQLEKGKISHSKAVSNLRSYFKSDRGKSGAAEHLFFEDLNKADNSKSLVREIAPMFFTGFEHQDIIFSLLEIDNCAFNFNEYLLGCIKNGSAFVRTPKQGAVKDLAKYLTYGLLPGMNRPNTIKASDNSKKMHDLSRDTYRLFCRLVNSSDYLLNTSFGEEFYAVVRGAQKARISLKK